ncbi:muscarinic Acetylcholine Receptor, C-type isoform X1 [Haematobia irritans]|uniref:muscarinic Acetylcholine Receptor, C-type isoform X1 n=1 Tax=Haematobia irritans TaxID=7368 RepID=UPI003F50A714
MRKFCVVCKAITGGRATIFLIRPHNKEQWCSVLGLDPNRIHNKHARRRVLCTGLTRWTPFIGQRLPHQCTCCFVRLFVLEKVHPGELSPFTVGPSRDRGELRNMVLFSLPKPTTVRCNRCFEWVHYRNSSGLTSLREYSHTDYVAGCCASDSSSGSSDYATPPTSPVQQYSPPQHLTPNIVVPVPDSFCNLIARSPLQLRYMTRKVAVIIIIFNWILGATVATIPMFWNNWNNAYECEFDEVLPPWYMAGMITPSFIVLWILMLLMYWRIVNEASKQASQMKKTMRKKTSPLIHPEWKSVQVVILIMGCFSLCWLPYFIVACAQLFEIYKISAMLYKISFSLAMANSALNPVIYSWKNSNFRQAFVQIIRCKSPNCYQKTSLDCLEKSSTCEKRSSNNVPRERFQIFPCSQLRLQTIYTVTDRMPAIQ